MNDTEKDLGTAEVAEAPKVMSDERIAEMILEDLSDALSYADTKLSDERAAALKYYYGEWPKRLHSGSSGYRSLDVLDQVETARTLLAETFLGSKLPFKVSPGSLRDAISREMATAYVNKTVFVMNDGEDIFDTVIFDALTARIGVAKVYWKKHEKVVRERRSGVTLAQLDALDESQFRSLTATIDEETGTAEVEVELIKDASYVAIETIPPEDFVINTDVASLSERAVAHRITKRMSIWESEGYSRDDLTQALDDDTRQNLEDEARHDAGSGATTVRSSDDPDVTLLEAYTTLVIEEGEPARMMRVLLAGDVILEKEEVDELPFVVFTPIRVSHTVHGASFTKTIVPTANAKTAITRAIIDHVMRTTNPRWEVLRNALPSPKDLLANTLGGMVNVNIPDGVRPLPQPPMNPHAFPTLQMLDANLEDTTGISKLTQGTSKEVISKQNSESMVNSMDERSQKRIRLMARRFASQFLVQLARRVYDIAQANDTEEGTAYVLGQERPINPSQWPDNCRIDVSLDLAPEQRLKRSELIRDSLATLSADPQLSQALSWEAKRAATVEFLKLRDFEDAELMISPEQPKPDPLMEKMKQLDMQEREMKMQLDQRKQALAEKKALTDQMVAMQQLDQRQQEFFMKQMQAQAEMALETRKQQAKEANDAFEKTMTLQIQEEDPEQLGAVVSVNR